MESQYDNGKIIDPVDKREVFRVALEQARSEGSSLWHSFSAFLLANSILVGFIAQILFTGKISNYSDNDIFLSIILSVLGIVVSILWFGTYWRRSNNYRFRMAQARQREPEHWNLIAGDGYQFSQGEIIEIRNIENKKPTWDKYGRGIGRFFNPRICMPIFITLFIGVYIVLILIPFLI